MPQLSLKINTFVDIPRGRYGAIYAHPPWYFKVWGAKGTGRGAFSHYDLMSADELRALPVGEIAAKDCMLFLWVPIPSREEGMELIKAWGFRYATVGFTWAKCNKGWAELLHTVYFPPIDKSLPEAEQRAIKKERARIRTERIAELFSDPRLPAHLGKTVSPFRIGTGYYTRSNPEECLIGVRGEPKILRNDIPQLIIEDLREHSRKPDLARERIAMLTPGPYIELFARESAPGLDCFGNQAGLFDNGPVKTRRQPSNLRVNEVCHGPS